MMHNAWFAHFSRARIRDQTVQFIPTMTPPRIRQLRFQLSTHARRLCRVTPARTHITIFHLHLQMDDARGQKYVCHFYDWCSAIACKHISEYGTLLVILFVHQSN